MSKSVPSKYIPQMQWQLACTGAKWVDFVSYNPNFPEGELQLFVARVDRNDDMINELETEVIKFLDEVEQTIIKLKE
jgi:predicted phage-related endonuclease